VVAAHDRPPGNATWFESPVRNDGKKAWLRGPIKRAGTRPADFIAVESTILTGSGTIVTRQSRQNDAMNTLPALKPAMKTLPRPLMGGFMSLPVSTYFTSTFFLVFYHSPDLLLDIALFQPPSRVWQKGEDPFS
jgi:hypothetical protein